MSVLSSGTVFGIIGVFAAIVSIIVQVLKNILPDSIPTKILTTVVSFIVVVGYTLIFGEISVGSIVMAIFGGFVVAFVSMFGFDSLKETILRFKDNGGDN